MKKYVMCVLAATSLLSTACGGGGSSGTAPTPVMSVPAAEYSIFVTPATNKSGQTIKQDGNANNPADDYVHISRDSEGLVFQYRDVENRGLLNDAQTMRTVKFATGSGTAASAFIPSGDYLKASATTTDTVNSVSRNAVGTLVTTDTLEVGGKQLGLSYADFGMWKTKSAFTGALNGVNSNFETMNNPEEWTNGKKGNEASFAAGGAGTATFTGNAMGVVREYAGRDDDVATTKFHELYGTASMTVDLSSRKADLALKFNDFYDFRFSNLGVSGRDGEISDDGASLSVTEKANNSGIHFNGNPTDFDVDGQFYGSSKSNPQEVVGDVEIGQIQGGNSIQTNIVFGAKK